MFISVKKEGLKIPILDERHLWTTPKAFCPVDKVTIWAFGMINDLSNIVSTEFERINQNGLSGF